MIIKALGATIKPEATRLATLAVEEIGKRLESGAREAFRKAQIHLTPHLQRIVEEECKKFSKIKTLFSEGKLVPIDSIYVEQNIKWGKNIITEADFSNKLRGGRRFVITGSAGAGKSMLLRQTYRRLASSVSSVYPIFIELRILNSHGFPPILDFVAQKLSSRKTSFTCDHVVLGLDEGVFCLLLDGFDEIDFDIRERYQAELLSLADKYPKATILLSSRFDPLRFRGWQLFDEVSMHPMTEEQTIELIGKIDEEEELKQKFIDQLRKRLFKTHSTFLSNPLLASMMLITFKRIADIPTKGHIFYKEAFSALYDRHDAQKGQYARKRYADLDNEAPMARTAFGDYCRKLKIDQGALKQIRRALRAEGLSAPYDPEEPHVNATIKSQWALVRARRKARTTVTASTRRP